MSTLFRCPPRSFVKHHDSKLPAASITGETVRKNCNSSAARDVLRDDHLVLLAIDAVLALHASFKKWRNRRRTLRALADLDDRQLRDIGLTRDEVLSDDPSRLLGHHKSYRAIAGRDGKRQVN